MSNWNDIFWMKMAHQYSTGSRDPRRKVGAIIVRPDKTVASMGVNGFPRGIADDERLLDRDVKNDLMIHAETNALLFSTENLSGYTLYCTFCPCIRCAVNIIQAGISRVVYLSGDTAHNWVNTQSMALGLFAEAKVELFEIKSKDLLDDKCFSATN